MIIYKLLVTYILTRLLFLGGIKIIPKLSDLKGFDFSDKYYTIFDPIYYNDIKIRYSIRDISFGSGSLHSAVNIKGKTTMRYNSVNYKFDFLLDIFPLYFIVNIQNPNKYLNIMNN